MSSGFRYEGACVPGRAKESRYVRDLFHLQGRRAEEDAIIACTRTGRAIRTGPGLPFRELLRNIEASARVIAIMRFRRVESPRRHSQRPEQEAWYRRVVSLTEHMPIAPSTSRMKLLTECSCDSPGERKGAAYADITGKAL